MALLATCGLLSACDRNGDGATTTSTEPSAPADETTTTTAERRLAPGQSAFEIDVVFQTGHFLVTVGEGVHDTTTGTLYLGLRFENLTDSWATPSAEGKLILGDTEHHVFLSSTMRIPPATSTDLTGEVRIGTATAPIEEGVLRWGRADETRTTIHLGTRAAEGFGAPLSLAVDAWGQIGKFTVHFNGGRLFADSLRGPRAPTGHHMMRLEFDEFTSAASPVNGFHPTEHFLLTWPDGTTVEPLGGSVGRAPMSWTSSIGNSVDFPVPPDPSGDYEILMASVGSHAFGLLHPDLVQRISIPVSIDVPADHGPRRHDGVAPLPIPLLPNPDRAPASPVDVALEGEVNVSGFAFQVERLTWDPAATRATVTGNVRLLPPVRPADDSFLAIRPQFAPVVALGSDRRLFGGLVRPVPPVTLDTSVPVAFEFNFVDSLDLEDLTLFLGRDHMTPSILPLGPRSIYGIDPPVPIELPVTSPTITAGNYRVEIVGYRFGLPRELDRPPAGMKALEVVAVVTAVEVEATGPFGLGFDTRSQLFLTYPDGYLQQSDNHEYVPLENGQTERVAATFYVPAGWEPGPMVVTVRSVDEIRAITVFEWVDVTFTAHFHPAEVPDDQEAMRRDQPA
ncbi:MAG TPA: hypothetical protein VLB67_00010 [Acidimicrobiia bacterium]|nr:hypothetical protein [Acidimicrobiia bacterium]